MPEPKITCISVNNEEGDFGLGDRNVKQFPITEINKAIEYVQRQGGGIVLVPAANFDFGDGIKIKYNEDPLLLQGVQNHWGGWPTIGGNKYGIYLLNSKRVTIEGFNIQNNDIGVCLDFSLYNTIAHNTANYNNKAGIQLLSPHNIIVHNTANYNMGDGINLSSSSSNTLAHNTANYNKGDGINLSSSSNNNIFDNTANSNDNGIYLDYFSLDNILYRNYAGVNEKWNFYAPGDSSNKWWDNMQNVFGISKVPHTVEIQRVLNIGDLFVPINPLKWRDNPLKRRVI